MRSGRREVYSATPPDRAYSDGPGTDRPRNFNQPPSA